jgi:hypothetical protein
MYNVTLRRVGSTTVAVEKQSVLRILSACQVALGIQHAMHMRHIVICDQPGSAIFFHIISQTAMFSRGKKGIEHEMCVLIFSTSFA